MLGWGKWLTYELDYGKTLKEKFSSSWPLFIVG